jgi:response regulator of citrate/malate metabolism
MASTQYSTEVSTATADAVRAAFEEDPNASANVLARRIGLASSTVCRKLDQMGLRRKVKARRGGGNYRSSSDIDDGSLLTVLEHLMPRLLV